MAVKADAATMRGLGLPAIIILFVFAKLFWLARYHVPGWDEAVYLAMGKYAYSLGSVGLWEMIRPPGLPLAIGWIWKSGLPYLPFAEALMVAFAIGIIIFTVLIARKLFDRNVAILAAALLASSPVFYFYSSHVFTEIPSTFFALAALYFFLNKKYYLMGALAALATLFKFPHLMLVAVFVGALAISWLFHKKTNPKPLALKAGASFSLIMLPYLLLNFFFYRSYTGNAFDALFRPFILGMWHQSNPAKAVFSPLSNYAFYIVESARQHFAFLLVIPAVLLFFQQRWFARQGRLLLAVYGTVYAAYFSLIVNKDVRFLLLFLPVVCIFAAAGFVETFKFLRKPRSAINILLIVALSGLLAVSFYAALVKDFGVYSWRPSSEPPIVDELYRSLPKLGIIGPVLTSDPVFAYYNDVRFFHYYDSSSGIPKDLKPSNEWEQQPFEAVIYSPQALYCPEGDVLCWIERDSLLRKIHAGYLHVFNASYDSSEYYVFVNESMQNKLTSS